MALYSIRSDLQFCERLKYDLLFQWFLDLNPDEETFDASSFSKNQERLLAHHVSELFFAAVVEIAREKKWVSNEHFSADGTLIKAWASMKSFRPKDDQQGPGSGNSWMNFHGEKRSNDTHQSTTDPEAKLLKKSKGQQAKLCFGAHAIMVNRNRLCVHIAAHPAVGRTEAEMALEQIDDLQGQGFPVKTMGADKGYHSEKFVRGCRERGVKPHVARVDGRKVEGRDGRTSKSMGYATSQLFRRRIEEIFGRMKTDRRHPQEPLLRSGAHAHGRAVLCGCEQPAADGKARVKRITSGGGGRVKRSGVRPYEGLPKGSRQARSGLQTCSF